MLQFVKNHLYFYQYADDTLWDTIYSESRTTARLFNTLNGKASNLWQQSWATGQKIRFEWGTNDFIEFIPESDIFVDRKAYNKIVALQELKTSDSNLASWVEHAGGAIFCISYSNGWDSAWGIKDRNDAYFGIGCNSGNWRGRGAFYGDDHYGAGWTGVRDNGKSKAGFNLGITIKMERMSKF